MTPESTALQWLTLAASYFDNAPDLVRRDASLYASAVVSSMRRECVPITATTLQALLLGGVMATRILGARLGPGMAPPSLMGAVAAVARQILDGHIDP